MSTRGSLGVSLLTCGLLAILSPLRSEEPGANWPGWRGPSGQGIADVRDLPLTWSAKSGENILWKVELPGAGGKGQLDQNQSSPMVVAGKVFVTMSYWPAGVDRKEFPEHHVACYRASDGRLLWDTRVEPGPWSRASDLRGGYTAPTPAADAERVVVVFGSSVIAALDHDGKLLWRKEIVPFDFDVAIGSSPVLYQSAMGKVAILQCDGVSRSSRILAYDVKSGEIRWEEKRPTAGFSHSTPTLVRIKDRPQLLVAASNAVQGVDPDNGKVLWWCQGWGDTVSPVYANGLVYCDGGRGAGGVCVDPTGSGDVTKTHRKWKIERIPQGFSSPVIVGEYLYRLTDPSILRCWKLQTGDEVYAKRFDGVSASVSPIVTADGRIYLASAGRSYVVKVGKEPEVLGKGELDDGSPASPAVAEGRIYLKGQRFLWCIGKKP
jgi:outer membrane protein assembly factor BamB